MSFNKLALAATVFGAVMAGSAYAEAGSAAITDVVLANEVRHAISAHPALAADQIYVQAAGGVVYLYGAVDSQSESVMAEEITQAIHGVQKVVNSTAIERGAN